MASQLQKPIVVRSAPSIQSHEEDEYAQQNEDNPLEVFAHTRPQSRPQRHDSLDRIHTHDSHPDEPPPPYEAFSDAPQIAPIEYSCENSPQSLVASDSGFSRTVDSIPRDRGRVDGANLPEGSPTISSSGTLIPAPLQPRPISSTREQQHRPSSSTQSTSTYSSSKAREAGFEIEPTSPTRSDSLSSLPSITVISSNEPLKHRREPGKLTAYLVPFPKPRIRGMKAEDIPDRFVVYTPPPPPLSKPGPNEKESKWHKSQRTWQEDVRKATMLQASMITWKGMKARTTLLVGKGVNLTRSSNVEFLDRVSGGAISCTAEDINTREAAHTTPTPQPDAETAETAEQSTNPPPPCPAQTPPSPSPSLDKEPKPKPLQELTLIYPPSLTMTPDAIRAEFVSTLLRTREKSRKQAVVASSLLPIAATIDVSLLFTLGGLTEISGVWAYTSIRSAMASKRMSEGLALGEERKKQEGDGVEPETEVRGCTCGHHEQEFGAAETVPVVRDKGKGKEKRKKEKKGIDLRMQASAGMEVLRRYLELACSKHSFGLFPQVEEAVGDVNEVAVLRAIGWEPVLREGRDLELEFKEKVERLTPEQDADYQIGEAREDVKRLMKKAAGEWVVWCKEFEKRREAAMKK